MKTIKQFKEIQDNKEYVLEYSHNGGLPETETFTGKELKHYFKYDMGNGYETLRVLEIEDCEYCDEKSYAESILLEDAYVCEEHYEEERKEQ